eukprot:4899115-Prymnesium_polylepis.1
MKSRASVPPASARANRLLDGRLCGGVWGRRRGGPRTSVSARAVLRPSTYLTQRSSVTYRLAFEMVLAAAWSVGTVADVPGPCWSSATASLA